MRLFTYQRVSHVAEAISSLLPNGEDLARGNARGAAKIVAGGTNLVDLMKADAMQPGALIDITRLPLNKIEPLPDGGLRIGALVTNSATAYDAEVQKRYPLLSRAILSAATPQLRNMATTGGNLLQRTRCYYFYDSATPCNKREPGTGCGAIQGINRIHAILGASEHCIATHPSDMAVALAALDCVIQVSGPKGDRAIAMNDFHHLPGDTPHIDTNLASNELITAVDLPRRGFADHFTYLKVRDRTSYAFALVSVAIGLEMEGSNITAARIALGGVAHRPWRDADAEAMLTNKPAAIEHFQAVADAIVRPAVGYRHNSFKIEMARRAIVRALQEASGLVEKS